MMTKSINKIFTACLIGCGITAALTGCKNGENDFADYEGGVSVYFANQTPVRTLVMGEDQYDTSLDNAHKCQIQATMGGSYSSRDITLQLAVDPSLCNKLYFDDGTGTYTRPVTPMPTNYYSLSSTSMKYNGFRGSIEVQLNDAFFNDPKALSANYVIPVKIVSQSGADRILSGTPVEAGTDPQHTWAGKWMTQPQDYTLYSIKYICKYDAKYLRRGVDVITDAGVPTTVVRHKGVEKDEVKRDIRTLALNKILYPVSLTIGGILKSCDLEVTFDGNDRVKSITSATAGVTVSNASGSYQSKSEKKAWGNKDRDGMYLSYKLDFGGGTTVATKDTLVWQDRGISKENFTAVYVE